MALKSEEHQPRTAEQLREHYLVEKDLANKLRNAPREERRRLYPHIYDELYQRLPLHPQLARKESPEETRVAVASQLAFLSRFLRPGDMFMEIGAGDCALSQAVARHAQKVYAIDVSKKITECSVTLPNLQLVITDGVNIDVPPSSITLAYSNQLVEHLHPEDAIEQLENIYRGLAPGGRYVCITPNRLGGPYDISRDFDREATGLHLREYTVSELSSLFRQIGFSGVSAFWGAKGLFFRIPFFAHRFFEKVFALLPYSWRKGLANRLPFRLFMTIRLVGTK